ncbi:helicase-exonuclease AddAB subunit AddA [Pseudalkalibacillus berkeleyi]|uniref:ATP-dependent helicase/nuclease subunit A n=1 Tax=Pseudalkalibacillus berkeleyi TaxID=1069813 RepID=A0ABS9GYP6_9BACL|nr:helicase-exonuclease AddAB subunit AddA [Pseudalkalibacillus berkeleyi]MCF6136769.1 helicase-exonuclease AddAB subunit AddA [Pseudalkalibacillus berkeleyi]
MREVIPKPEGAQWTDEQWQAITARGEDILVAAAAGSGKTAVLVERIIRRLTEKDGVDVDRLLIVTFTNAAAAEMRKRIGIALEKELKEKPGSLHLRRQLTLLNRASISTLHSFCIEVLRKYYYQLDLDPNFRIADETEVELIRQEVLEELLEVEYGKESNEPFYDLVDRFSNDRGDDEIQKMITRLYDFSRSYPWPEIWLNRMVEKYALSHNADKLEDLPWTSELIQDVQLQLRGMLELIEQAKEWSLLPGGPHPYFETLQEDEQLIRNLIHAGMDSWSAIYEAFQGSSFSRLKACKGDDFDDALKEQVKSIRDRVKKQVDSLKEDLFSRSPESYIHHIQELAPVMKTLVELVTQFSNQFQAAKKEKALVDFSDLEHYCLEILTGASSSETELVPSQAAEEYRQKFIEVLVDEYQDTNLVQESIVQLVTKEQGEGANLFMVGDVKQSIYRFRLAEPTLFLDKYKRYFDSQPGEGVRIDLSRNFRSRRDVIDSTNFLFKQIMNETVGEIEYDEAAKLRLGADFPQNEQANTELVLIDRSDEEQEVDEDIENLESIQLEARWMATRIKELIGHNDDQAPYQIYDGKLKQHRPITYRDIVILLRSTATAAPTIQEEFKKQGIPAYADLSSGYFEAVEVSVMMSLLQVIDNPYQDISLASVLRSPVIALTGEELAEIRVANKKGSYYEALVSYLKVAEPSSTLEKVNFFYKNLQRWRTKARQGDLSDLIWQIYRETGYYDYVGGMPGGQQRQANLRALYDRARQYENTSFRGLFRFLRFIERMKDQGKDLGAARALGEQEDVVRIMTIHKSKGLEFPVVMLANLNKRFNEMDMRGGFLLHKEIGLGAKFMNPTHRVSYPTLPQLAIQKRLRMEMVAEEMRILYVALTRAKEKLILIGAVKNLDKQLQQWQHMIARKGWLLPDFERASAKSYLDWIGPAVIRHPSMELLRERIGSSSVIDEDLSATEDRWNLTLLQSKDIKVVDHEAMEEKNDLLEQIKEFKQVTAKEVTDIEARLSWQYPYQQSKKHMSKQSVTELKRNIESRDEYGDTTLVRQFRGPIGDRPSFLQEKSMTAAEKGTAMHLVMQHLTTKATFSHDVIRETVAELVNRELMTETQADSVDIDSISLFFDTEVGHYFKNNANIFREVPFSLALPAKEAYTDWQGKNDEHVLVQGVMDCVIEEEDGFILLDYKTDGIKNRFEDFEKARPILEKRYAVQLDLYAKAIEEIWKKPCKEKYLYFFDGGHLLRLP